MQDSVANNWSSKTKTTNRLLAQFLYKHPEFPDFRNARLPQYLGDSNKPQKLQRANETQEVLLFEGRVALQLGTNKCCSYSTQLHNTRPLTWVGRQAARCSTFDISYS